MKSCPSCHQTYPDNAPDFCTSDGTPLVSSDPSYTPGGQWQAGSGQAPPPGWQQPQQNWGYPPPGQYPPSGGYPPPPPGGQYPPYGYAPAQGANSGLSKAALYTGIGALGSFLIAIVIAMIGASSGYSTLRDLIPFIGVLALLGLLAGLAAVVLGIVVISMASKNPAVNKVHGILGICFGAIPIVLWLIGLTRGSRF
jgi:hypothetical protein